MKIVPAAPVMWIITSLVVAKLGEGAIPSSPRSFSVVRSVTRKAKVFTPVAGVRNQTPPVFSATSTRLLSPGTATTSTG